MTVDLVVVGCGGHGREVVTIVRAVNEAAGRPVWRLRASSTTGPAR